MCGIAGIINLENKQICKRSLKRMISVLSHRGPDGQGLYINNSIGLAHTRLAIIDLSKNAQQPFFNESKTVCMIMNGEIYNYRFIKEKLIKLGHKFESNSDAEVIIHLYEELGDSFINEIEGMFVIALWDSCRRLFYLVRDRIGIKPVYYSIFNGNFVFASEPKSILQFVNFKKNICLEGLHYFLSLSYIPTELTIFQNIYKLLPAHFIKIHNNHIENKRYWKLKPLENFKVDENHILDFVESEIILSVKKHLMSDVPVGVFLSSGLDSSIIAYYASKLYACDIKSFTIGFTHRSFSELDKAQKISEFLNIENISEKIDDRIIEESILDEIIWYLDDLHPIHLPLYYLNKKVKRYFTVALSGDGGDELFGGYLTYLADNLHRYTRFIPQFLLNIFKKIIIFKNNLYISKISLNYIIERFISGNEMSIPKGHGWWNGMLSENDKLLLYKDNLLRKLPLFNSFDIFEKYYNEVESDDFMQKMMYIDIMTILPHNYLSITDKLSMANSIEVRPPFLDHKLVEKIFSLDSKYKLGKFYLTRKKILKELFKKIFHDSLITIEKKGFSAPLNIWMRTIFKNKIINTLNRKNIDKLEIFNFEYIKYLLDEFYLRGKDYSYSIWNIFNVILWYKKFIEN